MAIMEAAISSALSRSDLNMDGSHLFGMLKNLPLRAGHPNIVQVRPGLSGLQTLIAVNVRTSISNLSLRLTPPHFPRLLKLADILL